MSTLNNIKSVWAKTSLSVMVGQSTAGGDLLGRIGSILLCLCITVVSVSPHAHAQTKITHTKYMFHHLEAGEIDELIDYLSNRPEKDPPDLEPLFGLAAAYAEKGDVKTALTYVQRAVNADMPVERFLVGPRNVLAPLTGSAEFKRFLKEHPAGELLHGPMLGAVTHRSARFWVRTLNEVPFKVQLSSSRKMTAPVYFATGKTSADEDFTGVLEVGGLEPNTRYYYELFLDGRVATLDGRPSFRTYPRPGAKSKFRIAFGGGSNNKPEFEYMWDTILIRKPLAFLGLGDNNYYNMPEPLSVPRYCYYMRHSRPEWRRMIASTAVYAIWDDHDFAGNDSIGGPQTDMPAWKRPVWHVFRQNWVNPYYGGGDSQPGCWHDFAIGDVDFFMLDCRYYRIDPQGKNPVYTDPTAVQPSMLGPVQKKWLLDKLKASTATFKVIAASVPWAFESKTGTQTSSNLGRRPGLEDTWQGFAQEREDIFSFIEKHKIEGVFLISADRHRSDAWKIERENGYTFYETMSSHLTKNSTHPAMPGAIFTSLGKPAYGLLTIDTTISDPEIRYDVVKIDDTVDGTLVVKKSQLSFSK
jgi:alkaline phosphatase D